MRREIENRILIRNRHQISNFKEETVPEALLNVKTLWDTITGLSVDELKDRLPNQLILNSRVGTLESGTIYYRARIMGVKNWQNAGHWGTSQFWETPQSLVKHWGRLNRPNESVFYLSSDILQTFKEIRYQTEANKDYAVVVNSYKVVKPIHATQIGYYDKSVSVANIYSKMVNDIFSLPSERYGEGVYKLSNYLSNFYNFVPDNAAAFLFTPVLDPIDNVFNLAIEPSDAHKYFNYNGSIIIPSYKDSIDGNISVEWANNADFNRLYPAENLKWIYENFKIKF
ncbi:hypothetical protein [Levilactobacillus brevis]|uniref:hypothetical protein n=1 Tax=Levilactobacillus brevis TaxID=1580 RepID=UPI0035A3D249